MNIFEYFWRRLLSGEFDWRFSTEEKPWKKDGIMNYRNSLKAGKNPFLAITL